MGNIQRKARRYKIVSDAMVRHIVSCIESVPESELKWRVDDYERVSLKNPSRWARNASFPEIMVVLTKLGFENVWQMTDERNPLKAPELIKGTKELLRLGKIEKLKKAHREHKYFCLSGREMLKQQSLYSLLVAGNVFKQNPDSSNLLKSIYTQNEKNQKVVDEFISNLYELSETGGLGFNDWKILFLIRRWDDVPVKTLAIHGRLGDNMPKHVIQNHLNKLSKQGFLAKYGIKKASSYILTAKGWQAIMDAKRLYLKGLRFWDNGLNLQILNENGSSTEQKSNS